MNFIGAALLYHSDEVVSHYLFERLLKDYGLIDVYSDNLGGVDKHC
jgi:hypothetical protein